MNYKKGLHILATLKCKNIQLLRSYEPTKTQTSLFIQQLSLTELGSVFHNFSPEGFTAVVCLSESHISIHTWPEYEHLNMDIYLSNHEEMNDDKAHALLNRFIEFYDATLIDKQEIYR